jgi:hypothetical protein
MAEKPSFLESFLNEPDITGVIFDKQYLCICPGDELAMRHEDTRNKVVVDGSRCSHDY